MTPSPLELLLAGRFKELVELLDQPAAREQLLAQATAGAGLAAPQALAQRQLSLLASGDWSWGLLSPAQRQGFLVREARLLGGGGQADGGAAQARALRKLRAELGNLYGELELALQKGDLEWLSLLAEHLVDLLAISGGSANMVQRYEALLAAGLRLGSPELELHARLGLCSALTSSGSFEAAVAEGGRAATLARRLRRRRLYAAALHLRGSALAMAGQLCEAQSELEAALAQRRGLRDRRAERSTLANLAYVEQARGQAAQAEGRLREALALSRELGDQRGAAMLLQNLAILAQHAGRNDEVAVLAAEALAVFRALDDRPGAAGALINLGYAALSQAEPVKARRYLEEALRLSCDLGDAFRECAARLALGALEGLQGQIEPARGHFEAALTLCRTGGDRAGQARALCGLANLSTQPSEAASWLLEALSLFRQAEDQQGCVDLLLYGGALLMRQATDGTSGPLSQPAAARLLDAAEHEAAQIGHAFDPFDLKLLATARELCAAAPAAPAARPGESEQGHAEWLTKLEAALRLL